MGGSLSVLPTPLEGPEQFAHDAQNDNLGPSLHKMHNRLQGGSHEEAHKMRPLRQHMMRRLGRKQLGLKVWSSRIRAMNGREASGLHGKPMALFTRKGIGAG